MYQYLKLPMGFFEVLATSGNNKLGGDDFDDKIIDYLVDTFKRENGIDLKMIKWFYKGLKKQLKKQN